MLVSIRDYCLLTLVRVGHFLTYGSQADTYVNSIQRHIPLYFKTALLGAFMFLFLESSVHHAGNPYSCIIRPTFDSAGQYMSCSRPYVLSSFKRTTREGLQSFEI
jgi:hypothetical protein